MPAYNVEKYIGEALQSLLDQSLSPDEIVIINDGSTDSTLSVISGFSFSCPLTVITTENNGQGAARNIGVSLAASDYIYYLDSDDLLDKDFIKIAKQELIQSGCPDIFLFSGESFFDDHSQHRMIEYKRGFEGFFESESSLLRSAKGSHSLSCSPCLYVSKRKLWGAGKLEFGPNYYEDDALFYPLLFSCSSFRVIDTPLFRRRIRKGSTMTIPKNEKHVLGALNCLVTTLELYHSFSPSSVQASQVAKKVEAFSIKYIRCCRVADYRPVYAPIFLSLKISKRPRYLVRLFVSWIGLNRLINILRSRRTT